MKGNLLALFGSLLNSVTTATADSIAIDWYGSGKNEGTSQARMARSETAGVVPQQHWNSFTGPAPKAGQPLVDSNGAMTGATVIWKAAGMWDTNAADVPGNARMMLGYLSNGTEPGTVTVSGIPAHFAATGYDVYVYSDGDNNLEPRSVRFTIGEITAVNTDPANQTFTGVFVEGSNYVCLRGLTAATFTLTATSLTGPKTGMPRAPINGIQIVQRAAPAATGK
jgi:hypothetical protein